MLKKLKQSEEELQIKNRELRKKNCEIEEANLSKDEFLANMSHDLRTPINGIIGFSELLCEEKIGHLSKMQKECINDILSSAKHLLLLINDVLDISKVEAGKIDFHPEKINFIKILRETRNIFRKILSKKTLSLH